MLAQVEKRRVEAKSILWIPLEHERGVDITQIYSLNNLSSTLSKEQHTRTQQSLKSKRTRCGQHLFIMHTAAGGRIGARALWISLYKSLCAVKLDIPICEEIMQDRCGTVQVRPWSCAGHSSRCNPVDRLPSPVGHSPSSLPPHVSIVFMNTLYNPHSTAPYSFYSVVRIFCFYRYFNQ